MDLGLPFSSGCAETHQVDLSVMVKEEDIKEEEYGHMISCPDEDEEEEKPFAEFDCKAETDVTESPESTYNETVKTEEEEEEEEEEQQHDWLLESVPEDPHVMQQKIHGQNDELNLQLKGRLEKHQPHSENEKPCKKPHKYSHCTAEVPLSKAPNPSLLPERCCCCRQLTAPGLVCASLHFTVC
ncbi:hypothetical protein AALO_G00091510 [Alosa alosa]|uniref:Uncharacterized protein n=1 Tax=Alosa alosa TaxID=278164 RepID=A0AAV6GST6_9TELE|nr:hypothetical protein AALO_G00091510 [Alosa alosa]